MTKSRVSPVALGMALGVFWGISVLVMGLFAHYYSYGVAFVESLRTLYVGYQASVTGSFIGGLIGFVDGFFCGAIIAWLYNMFSCCCKKDKCN